MRTWLATLRVLFPTELPLGPGGELPQTLDPQSRIPTSTIHIGDVRVSISPTGEHSLFAGPTGQVKDINWEWGKLVFLLDAAEMEDAVDRLRTVLDPFLNSLSFQMQCALGTGSLEVIDVTPPVQAGDQRRYILYPEPTGFPRWLFAPASALLGGGLTDRVPTLEAGPNQENRIALRALEWYIKGLAAGLQVDRFIFFWIATDILSSASEVEVRQPYKAPCNHEIAMCPECGTPTSRYVQGQTHQAFLQQVFGLAEDISQGVWKARQILHGAIPFDSATFSKLTELSSHLQAGLLRELKRQVGIPDARPPFLDATTGVHISPAFLLAGPHEITAEDIAALGQV